jgi:hypothetical protein
LAGLLEVPLSKRQSHAALLNTLVKHVENQQMDMMIRTRQAPAMESFRDEGGGSAPATLLEGGQDQATVAPG